VLPANSRGPLNVSKMRILMSGCSDPNGLENCYARGGPPGFELLQLEPATRPSGSVLDRAAAKIFRNLRWARFNKSLLERVASLRPDVLWIFKGMEVFPATLRELRSRGVTLVNYNPDHPLRYFSKGSGNTNVGVGVPEYHLHLTYSRRIAEELRDRYSSIRVGVVPFGHEISDQVFRRIGAGEDILRLCFIGNPDENRASTIRLLLDAGLPVDVYGHQWDRFLKATPGLQIHNQVLGVDMLRTIRNYRVQLNLLRPHNEASHNMRSFEVPASGGIMLAEDTVEHRDFFESEREAFYFRTPRALIESARYLLALSKGDAEAIRNAARLRSMVSGYTYSDRALQAITMIGFANEVRSGIWAGGDRCPALGGDKQ
jgi:spore maturation protein CgeB